MQLIQIDAVEAQPFETSIDCLLKVVGSTVWHPLTGAGACEPAFRSDHKPFWIRIKRLGNEQFACVWTICVGGVDQIHAKLHRVSENFQRVLSIGRPAPDAFACDAHRAKAKSIDSEVAAQIKRRI